MFLLLLVTTAKGENIIFEQIGTLAGTTSYLHPHVTINISSIECQYNLYRAFVLQEIEHTSSASAMAAGPVLHGSTRKVFSDPKAELNHYMKESRFKGADDIIDDKAKHKKFPPQSRDVGPEIYKYFFLMLAHPRALFLNQNWSIFQSVHMISYFGERSLYRTYSYIS